MALSESSISAVRNRVGEIAALPDFRTGPWWLTFYLCGTAPDLGAVARELSELDGINLQDADGGFLYPKIPVGTDADNVVSVVVRVFEICRVGRVEFLHVDIDTSPDVVTSRFKMLFEPKSSDEQD
ncbi:MAG: hypothetical protein V4459_04670 [Pseudomonadota bacterium]